MAGQWKYKGHDALVVDGTFAHVPLQNTHFT